MHVATPHPPSTEPRPRRPRSVWLLALAVSAAGCTSVDKLSATEIRDELNTDILIPEDAGAEAGMDYDSDMLCEFPPTPPRLPAASIDEKTCSNSSDAWPECIPDECGASDFETACLQFCQMNCERHDWFCDRFYCQPPDGESEYCGTEEATQECRDLCGDDPDCLNMACADIRGAGCEEFTCLAGDNVCGGQTCNNSCDRALNGVCEDGSPINAEDDRCAIGTDCADCGAREDECFPLGAECFATSQCCGFEDFSAWCAEVASDDDLGSLGRCIADCSDDDSSCREGFTCEGLEGGDSAACFPFCSFSQGNGN